MKRNTLKGKVYNKLIYKLFLQTIIVLVASAAIVLLLRILLMGRVADGMVSLIASIMNISWDEALGVYQRNIRNNMDLIMILAVIILFFVFFRLSLSWFTKYFDQIVDGVDKLAQESSEEIVMSSELKFIETKLNEVRVKLKRRAEEAQAAEQRKNDLVVYLAHDIKTPLTSVIGYLSLLDEAHDMPDEQKYKYTHIALEKAYRLETLINEFFEITRYNLQSVPLERERIDLCYMMIQISDELYPQLVNYEKKININIDDDITIFGDSEKLARVFNNILKNAIAYSKGTSPIYITARQEVDKTIISFRNEGEIPKEKLNSVFEKFYRLDSARQTATGGAGLGLAIARDIINLHGGDITADSVYGYTIFTVELPAAPTP